jgi:phosphoribosylpyrophosphate synthetase
MSHLEPEAKIFACSQSVYLAENFRTLRIPLGKVTMSKYSDGEFQPSRKSLSEEYVYLLFVPLFQIQII